MTRDRSNPHWREEAALLGVDPDETDDAVYWGKLDRARAIVDTFHYHKPSDEQIGRISQIRVSIIDTAKVILRCTRVGADQTAALRQLHEAMMTANKSIACEVDR